MRHAFAAASIPAEPSPAQPVPIVVDEIAQLHADHYVPLVRLAVVLIDQRESAEEVVQDAFLSNKSNEAAPVVAITSANPATALLVRDSRANLTIFVQVGSSPTVMKLAVGRGSPLVVPVVVPGIRLSGPGT